MADSKKNTTPTQVETAERNTAPAVSETPTAEAEKPDPARMVKIKLQKVKGKGKGQFVRVNDHRYFIPYGEVVEVPAYIAAVLENSMAQDERTTLMIEGLAPPTNL